MSLFFKKLKKFKTNRALCSSSDRALFLFRFGTNLTEICNDFILVESAALCDRDFSVCGDCGIYALDLTPSSAMADVQMRIYNSDKSEPEMCGNGICCYAQFLRTRGRRRPPSWWRRCRGPSCRR